MKVSIFIFILTLGFFSQKLNAQIATDRPDQTESSLAVPNGGLQIETGILVGFEGENQMKSQQ